MIYKCALDGPLCDGELWQCRTCKEWFCEFHFHDTSLGYCVECVACEHKRLKEDYQYCAGCDMVILPGEAYEDCLDCGGPLCEVCVTVEQLCPDCGDDHNYSADPWHVPGPPLQ